MGKNIWLILTFVWVVIAGTCKMSVIDIPELTSGRLDYAINVIGIFLIVCLIISRIEFFIWLLIWCLRGPVLLVLMMVTFIGQLLMMLEHRIVRFSHWINPSPNRRGL